MARRFYAVFAVAIALCVLATGLHLPMARASASPHPAAVLTITPYNSYGWVSGFSPGPGVGYVYFYAFDSGADTTGTVRIIDQNYTRDGVPAVAATWSITFQGNYNDSRGTSVYYTIPQGLNFSGLWEINLTAGNTSVQRLFTVEVYSVSMDLDQDGYLPGHSGNLFTYVEKYNGAPFSNIQSLELAGEYYTIFGAWLPIPGLPHSLPAAAFGTVHWTLPTNASQGDSILFMLWANQTLGTATNWSRSTGTDSWVAGIVGVELAFTNCVYSCATYPVGTPIELQIIAMVGYFYYSSFRASPGGGLIANVSFFNGVSKVGAPVGTPTMLTTNATGMASLLFVPTASNFSTTHNNSVHVNVTDPVHAGTSANNSINFYLQHQVNGARMQLTLPQLVYYSGDNITATWTLGGANSSSAVGWTPGFWDAYTANSPYRTFAEGTITSTASTGTVSFLVPTDFQGAIWIYVSAYNNTTSVYGEMRVLVVAPTLLINPSETNYRAGDSIMVSISTLGQAFSTASFYQTTWDSAGNVLGSGVVTGNSFTFVTPTVAPPTEIEFRVVAQTPLGGVIASASTYVILQAGYQLTASVTTASSYTDGSYQPGQTVTISYNLVPLGTTPTAGPTTVLIVPTANEFAAYFGTLESNPGALLRSMASSSGSIQFTLPSNLPDGYNSLLVLAYPSSEPACSSIYSGCAGFQMLTVNVQANPPALSYEIGAGSGLNLGWLVLLVLIVVLALVGVLWVRRRMRGPGGKTSEPVKPYSPPPSPSGGPNSPSSGSPPPSP